MYGKTVWEGGSKNLYICSVTDIFCRDVIVKCNHILDDGCT